MQRLKLMVELRQTTRIHAPIEHCFLLSLSIDLEMTAARGLRAIGGCTSGLIGKGQTVQWEIRAFGSKFRHTSQITGYDAPYFFQDTMLKGAFRSFAHDHWFHQDGEATRMDDVMRFSAPLGIFGRLAEIVALRSYMLTLLRNRNRAIQEAAETEAWKRFLPAARQT
jgi:ligand-binding SRPBCC domain-containing protein